MKKIFWNVDTQYDFMRDDESFKGALPVPNARGIEDNLAKLTKYAKQNEIYVVNTADWHTLEDDEIDAENPNFVDTYPPHCMANTRGAEYVPATRPENLYRLTRDAKKIDTKKLREAGNLVIEKYKFDVFAGNPLAAKAINILNPDKIIIYGVALNACNDFAVMGNIERGRTVYAIIDAMKDLPDLAGTPLDIEKVLEKWKNAGVNFTTTKNILEDRI